MESVGYALVYFARSSLLWQGPMAATNGEKGAGIKEMKGAMLEELPSGGFFPGECATYINYIQGLALMTNRTTHACIRRPSTRFFERRDSNITTSSTAYNTLLT